MDDVPRINIGTGPPGAPEHTGDIWIDSTTWDIYIATRKDQTNG